LAVAAEGKTVRGPRRAGAPGRTRCRAGTLTGAGYLPAAAIATVLVLLAHLGLRPLARRIDRLPAITDTEVETIYDFRAICRAADKTHIRVLVVQALTHDDFTLHSVRSEDLNAGSGLVEVTAELHRYGRDDVALEAAVSRLSLEPSVSSVTWNTREPALVPAEE
jgi:putative Mg2+ transporter-C (MgtC) family protein